MNMRATRQNIEDFLQARNLAIAGVSRDPKKFGNIVFRDLRKKGYEVTPVNPNVAEIDGVSCFSSVAALPEGTKSLLVLTSKPQTYGVVKEALDKGIGNIWIQQMSETPETVALLKDKPVNVIMKKCILMFADPVTGGHKLHRGFLWLFGLLPR